MAPFLSTFTLATEIVITTLVLAILYFGYAKNRFLFKLTAFTLGYEVIFNISYMAYQSLGEPAGRVESAFETGLAIFHGTLSLIMFIALVVFFVFAWRGYRQGRNYFKEHRTLTIVFIIFWLMAVVSGTVFYFVLY